MLPGEACEVPLVTHCGFRYWMSATLTDRTQDWCAVCERFYSGGASCPDCELRCESCEYWAPRLALTVLRHGRYSVEQKFEAGPWDSEPDRFAWWHRGHPCVMRRTDFGAWCGYVGVRPEHPWRAGNGSAAPLQGVSVHGGVTFAGDAAGWIRYAEDDGHWYVGFDCAHHTDRVPAFGDAIGRSGVEVYRTFAWVMQETDRLAEQAADAGKIAQVSAVAEGAP